jgi:hypothetical protein
VTGFFNNPNTQYYLEPQTLDKATGFIQGHQHVTMQSITLDNPADPTKFVFFKGLNDPAVNDLLSVVVPKGIP